jgi:hypothetical protein
MAFASNCMQTNNGISDSCESSPLYAINYFDSTGYTAVESIDAAVYTGGFNTSGTVYDATVCI